MCGACVPLTLPLKKKKKKKESKDFNLGSLMCCLLSSCAVGKAEKVGNPSYDALSQHRELLRSSGTALSAGSNGPSLPPVLSQCPRGWDRADLPVGSLLSLHGTSQLLVAEGTVTGTRHPRFWVGCSVTSGNLLKYNFLFYKMRKVISTV